MEKQEISSSPVKGTMAGATPAVRSVREQLKNLRAEDFMSPNQVLCYGGGGAFQGVAKYMTVCSINIVGVIDANKRGTVDVNGKVLPYLSLSEAIEAYGTNVIVIITIANERIFQQVKGNLLEKGFSEDRIFDLNVWTWLTVPSEKSYCKDLAGYMQFFPAGLSKCCNVGVTDAYLCEWFIEGRPLQAHMDYFLEKRMYYIAESNKGRIPLYCRGCRFLSESPSETGTTITQFIVSDHAFCNADCVYCCDACSVPRQKTGATVQERYAAILYTLKALQQTSEGEGLDQRAIIQLAGGELTINPHKEKIYETVKGVVGQMPEVQLQIFSNCFLYDQEIGDLLSLGKASFLQCDLDAGTPETYIKVKGFNKFDVVRENLKRYAQFGTVKLKYIVLPGWNDSQLDYEGTIALLNDLHISELQLSPEYSLSQSGNPMQIREMLYATARFMALLEQNNIQAVFLDVFWKREHLAIAKRLCREIQSLY